MSAPPGRAKGRRTLLLIALVAFAPIIASYTAYYWLTPSTRLNYGELIGPLPAPPIAGKRDDGSPFDLESARGKWLLLVASGSACDEGCRDALYATRQARTIQGRERDRVARIWLQPVGASVPTDKPAAAPTPDDGALVAAYADPGAIARLPLNANESTILILDPRGNIVLRYGAKPDIKRLAKDLERLLRASQMG